MCLGIGQRERRTPRAARHNPLLDPEVIAQLFDVFDQQLGVIECDARVGLRQSGTALIIHDEIVGRGIVEAPRRSIQACTLSAMQVEHRQPFRIAAFLIVEVIALPEVNSAAIADQLSIIESHNQT